MTNKLTKGELTLGIDIGNAYVKTSTGVRFLSRASHRFGKSYADTYSVERNGSKLCVGDIEGSPFTTNVKYTSDEYNTCLLTAIFLSDEEGLDYINAHIILGTPVDIVDSTGLVCKEEALKLGEQTITIDGVTKTINIVSVKVVPQSCVVSRFPELQFPLLVIDIGGGTSDISIWNLENNKLVKVFSSTKEEFGFDLFIKSFRTILSTLEKNPLNVSYKDAIKIIDSPVFRTARYDLDFTDLVDGLLKKYVSNLKSVLESEGITENILNVVIIGGPSKCLKPHIIDIMGFREEHVHVSDNPQFDNALAFEDIGGN